MYSSTEHDLTLNDDWRNFGLLRIPLHETWIDSARQVHGVAQMLSGTVPFRSCCFTGGTGRRLKTQSSLLQVRELALAASSLEPIAY